MSLRPIQTSCRLTTLRHLSVRTTRTDWKKPLNVKAVSTTASSTKKTMKRSSASSTGQSKPKKPRLELPEYHTTPSVKTASGDIIWPAPADQIEAARDFILEWSGLDPLLNI
jgi:hypothetical protein